MVPVGSETFKGILVSRQSFEFFHELTVQLCALGVLMTVCSGKDVKHASW